MMNMRPPQQGHGRGRMRAWSAAGASVVSGGSGLTGTASSSRARAMLTARVLAGVAGGKAVVGIGGMRAQAEGHLQGMHRLPGDGRGAGGEIHYGLPPNETGRSDHEGPQHIVTIAQPFAMGKLRRDGRSVRSLRGGHPPRLAQRFRALARHFTYRGAASYLLLRQ